MTVRMRHTKGHQQNRRSHHAIEKPAITSEGQATVPHLRHRASPVTGSYRGRKVMNVDTKIAKRVTKKTARTEAKKQTK